MADGRDTPDLPRGLIDRRGTPLGKAARLPSIRGPRDLTLGGIPKKIFTPNIPVRKPVEPKEEKKEEISQPVQSEAKSKGTKDAPSKPKKEKTFDRGQGKGRNRGPEIIQSHSIFEQGPSGKTVVKNSSRDTETVGGKFHSKTSSASTSTARVLKNSEMEEDSKEVIDFLLRDDFIDDRHMGDKYMEPVNLPLSKLNMEMEAKPVEIKADPDGDVEMTDTPKLISVPTVPSDTVLEALTKSEESELLFFQFPDCLPGVPSNRNVTDEEEKEEEPSSQTQMLSDFSEGAVGKLVIRKSGRAQLVMGNITMDVSMGTKCGFLQDVVSINTHDSGGDLSVLGHIKHRLVCIPDFDNMLNT